MKDYASMSDQKINQLVGEKVSRDGMSIIASDGNAVIHEYSDCGDFKGICLGWKVFDPCNNPADAWPIISDKKICLAFDVFAEPQDGGGWVASPAYGWETERVRHVNPLRAAMIVFLMMKESEK